MAHNQVSSHLIYLSSFEYPSTHAHPLHALSMARAFSALLGDRFLFVIGRGMRDPILSGVPHANPFKEHFTILKSLHLRALGTVLWLSYFLLRNPEWKENLIIFTNDLKLAAAAGLIRPLFGFSLVLEIHGTAGIANRLAVASADRLIFVTRGLRKDFEISYGADQGKGIVLPNAVDPSRFRDTDDGRGIRESLGIPEGAFVIGYVGRFKPMKSDKGIDFMVDALAELPEDVYLLLVGGSKEEIQQAEARVLEKELSDRVRLVPHVLIDTVPRYLQACDALGYVPPATDQFLAHETSPMKLFEYMASGRPIIASDLPAFREALGDGALFIPPGSRGAFIDQIRVLRTDLPVRATVIAAASKRISGNTWENRARTILATESYDKA